MPAQLKSPKIYDFAPPLTAKLAPWMQNLLKSPTQLADLLSKESSPLHIVVMSEFKRNIKDLLKPFSKRSILGGLFYACKANKLEWFIHAAKEENLGVDVASLQELRSALKANIRSEQIIVTATWKEHELVLEAIAENCLLVIDNLDDLTLISSIAQSLGKTARVALRLSGFTVNGQAIFSRFGFHVNEWSQLLAQLDQRPWLKLEMLHAHLDRYDIQERIAAAHQLIDLTDNAKKNGHSVSSIDLGGGILVRYLEEEEEWKNFSEALVASVAGKRDHFTYSADGLGYYKVQDNVFGSPDFYPAWNPFSKERFIEAILDGSRNSIPLHKEISDRGLKIFFEPGRALLDNAGITLARIIFRKRDTLGNLLIGLAMNRTNLHPFRAEFCLDPILLSNGQREICNEGAFLVGNMCSESDLIFKRKLQISHLPLPDDIVFFPNTAGYFTHLLETATHGNPLPKNILLDPNTLNIQASA